MSQRFGNQTTNKFLEFDVLNIPMNQATYESSLNNIHAFCSADVFVVASKDYKLKKIIKNSTIYCDSKPLQKYLKLKYGSQIQIRGTDFMRNFLCSKTFDPHKHLFIGGSEEVKTGINNFVHRNSSNSAPIELNFIIPPVNVEWETEYRSWLQTINFGKFVHVWIGLGNPKQFFIANLLSQNNADAQYYCVGAAFNFLSGVKSETPRILQKLALEWLFRFLQEPKRLWRRYLVGNLTFLKLILIDMSTGQND